MSAPVKRVSGRHGEFLVPSGDIYIGRSLELYGQWCEAEVALFAQVLKPGAVVIEVGANLGSHTVPLARMAGPEGAVFAVEMQPFLAQLLAANVALNGLGNVAVVNAGVAEEEGVLKVPPIRYGAEFNFGGISVDFLRGVEAGSRWQTVPLTPLDALVGTDRLDLLKLDVEGFEAAALRGAEGLISRHRPVIYLENDHPEATPALLEILHGHGYKCYWHRSFLYDARNHAENPENVFGQARCINLLAVPGRASVAGLEPAPDAASHPKLRGG